MVSHKIVWIGLVGEQSGFLMTNGCGFLARIFSASMRFDATNDLGNGILNFAQSSRAKSRSRSIRIASPVGEKIPTPELIKSFAQGCVAQSMDCGIMTSILFCLRSGTGLGNASREKVSPTSVGEKCP